MKTETNTFLKPNIQLFAESVSDSASAESASNTAADNSEAVNIDSNVTETAEQKKPFKVFENEADFQREMDFRIQQAIKTHEERLKSKLTPKIREQVEKEANMTAEQKLQEQLKIIEAEKKEIAKEKVRMKVESLFVAKNISEADRQVMLDSIVDDDEEGSTKRAQALLSAIDHAVNEKIKASMKQVKAPNTGTDSKAKSKSHAVTFAEQLAKQHAESAKASKSALDYYINGGRKA